LAGDRRPPGAAGASAVGGYSATAVFSGLIGVVGAAWQ
jgi:hypothetical protein